ncbi:hypothetical protein EYF80_036838 [Liparis tanakae]|uniref:Uncharacterized protein n=1 Tax=Liparis tanakae TaxID=230148 RepID=A0A4Z2GJB3_9TELE|nr:hypothetical protein EYF80_036838 [Liparis tanakae]
MTAEECNASSSQTCTDQPQVLHISQEEDDAALEDQPGAEENSECHFEKNQDVSQEEPSDVDMTDVKETTKETAAGIPAKKKRRMGMCGLTERERSHFLQTRKRESGQTGPERVGKQICNNSAELAAQEEVIPSVSPVPVGNVTEQEKAEMQLESSHCGGEDRTETEVHIAATASDGAGVVSDPGCSEDKSCEVEGGLGPGPEPTGDMKSDQPPGEEEEQLLGNQEQQEHEGGTAEIVTEELQEQMQDGEDGSAAVQSPAVTCRSPATPKEETEDCGAIEAAALQVASGTRTREEEVTGDAGGDGAAEAGGASSTHTQPGGREAAGTPRGPEVKDSCAPEAEPGAAPSSVNAEPPQTSDSADPFGSGYLDYVSDSQLNTIILSEEVVMEREDLDCPDHEDASDLICGLIRELSTLK